jgi:hypothetical protein
VQLTRRQRLFAYVRNNVVLSITFAVTAVYVVIMAVGIAMESTVGPPAGQPVTVPEPSPSVPEKVGRPSPSPEPPLAPLTYVPGGGPPVELREAVREDHLWEMCVSELTEEQCYVIFEDVG